MSNSNNILAEHYQKTYELTMTVWEQRNRTFLVLLVVVGVATLLTFRLTIAEPLLVDIVAKLAGTPTSEYDQLRRSFPYGLVQSIFLMVIMYLMVVLYHRTYFIKRCYKYLEAIEPEIHMALALPINAKAFTRESTFYRSYQFPYEWFVGRTYIAMLGALLVIFLGNRIYSDISTGTWIIAIVDIIIAAPTLLFYYAYAKA